jgi:hypothetical protein
LLVLLVGHDVFLVSARTLFNGPMRTCAPGGRFGSCLGGVRFADGGAGAYA